MSRVIVTTSGKGGVGKTTTSASIAMGLARRGYKTAVLDFDIGLRNLDLIMGCERRVIYDFINVIQGEATLNQALIQDKVEKNLYILAASQTQDKESLTKEGVEKIINELDELKFDYVICDSPAGIEQGALMAMHFADEAIIVSNPEVSSIRDSDKIIGLLDSKTDNAAKGHHIKKHLLITRYDEERAEKGEMILKDDIQALLSLPIIGIITESRDVISASNIGRPVIVDEESLAGMGYQDTVSRILGDDVEMIVHSKAKKGFLRKLFGGRK